MSVYYIKCGRRPKCKVGGYQQIEALSMEEAAAKAIKAGWWISTAIARGARPLCPRCKRERIDSILCYNMKMPGPFEAEGES